MALLTAKRAKKAAPQASDDSSDEQQSDASDGNEGNAGWANSILKVLQTTKPETKNKTVLSRAKKLKSSGATDGSKAKKPAYDFEIAGGDAVKEEQDDDEEAEVKPQASALDAQLTRQQRKNVPLQLRVKPSYKDMERERSLRKVATRGTVQFFNAVRIQQKELQQQLDEAGPLDSRQDAVLNNIDKRKFLDVLMSGKRAKSSQIDNAVKKEEPATDTDSDEDEEEEEQAALQGKQKKSEWNVLREDFMTNKKIKHWDEEEDDDEQAAGEQQPSGSDDDDVDEED
ncbi:hypothetical protein KR222_001437 [Zaprionus bogoriensis]|nr:hypothetical protein KR222_001437 [Zaprionus bogoriensis]